MKSRGEVWALSAAILAVSAGVLYAGCGTCGPRPKAVDKAACVQCVAAKGACVTCAPAKSVKTVEKAEIDSHVLERLIASKAKVVILDARSGKWDDGRRIPGAKQLAPSASAKEVAKLIKSKKSLVVTYCTNLKCGASGKLAARLAELGYKNVIEYPYGIDGWAEHGGKVVKTK